MRCADCIAAESGVPSAPAWRPPPPSPRAKAPLLLGIIGCAGVLLMGFVVAAAWILASGRSERGTAASGPRPVAPIAPPGAAPAGASPAPVAPPPPAAPSAPIGFPEIACPMVDSNGDGVFEIGGVIARRDRTHPAMIDGASGAVIWEGAPIGSSDYHILCLGPGHLGVVDQRGFELSIFPSTGVEGEVRRSLSDELSSFSVGEGCATLRTEDEQSVSISLADASDAPCAGGRRIRSHIVAENTVGFVHGIYSMLRPLEVSHGDAVYTLRTRRPGTPLLEVSASRGGRERWSRAVPYLPVGGDAIGHLAGAAAPGVVVVAGEDRDKDFFSNRMYLIGLDAETGAERYVTATEGGGISGMFNNGRYIIVATERRLVALEPASGAIAWELAAR